MTVAVCLCDNGGMLFNKRRQSSDRILLSDFMALANGETVFISPFSEKLFSDYTDRVTISEAPLSCAKRNNVVFVEDLALSSVIDSIDKMIIYRWNRSYPADFYLDTPPKNHGFYLSESVDFVGSSHDNITREIWIKG